MRNPHRIDRALRLLQLIWTQQPDTRFFQLIHNLQVEYREQHEWKGTVVYEKIADAESHVMFQRQELYDFYNLEDDDFIAFLKQKLEEE